MPGNAGQQLTNRLHIFGEIEWLLFEQVIVCDNVKLRPIGIVTPLKRVGDYVIPRLVPMWILLSMPHTVYA